MAKNYATDKLFFTFVLLLDFYGLFWNFLFNLVGASERVEFSSECGWSTGDASDSYLS